MGASVAARLLCAAALLVAAGCGPKPDTAIAQGAIAAHFEQQGYRVTEITVGKIYRNPVSERVYMAPLTYVVEVPAITLEPGDGAAGALAFTGASFKIQARSQPRRGWVVAQVDGVELPAPSR